MSNDYEPIQKIIVHHSESTRGNVAMIREWHRERNYLDIGYHFVICNGDGGKDGEIQLGRPVTTMGAHARGHNEHTVGVCLVGKFMEDQPTARQRTALVNLLTALCTVFGLDPVKDVIGHRDVNPTDCPGDNLYALLDSIRSGAALRMVTTS